MTFEEAYLKYFSVVVKFCLGRNGGDVYYAEEATAKAFEVLYRKWKDLASHDEPFVRSFLFGTARNTIRETRRKMPPEYEPLDEPWCLDLVEEQMMGRYDSVSEPDRFDEYIAEIKEKLDPKEKELFQAVVVDEISFEAIAERDGITPNAVRLRWFRLKTKLKPLVEKILTE